MRLCVPAPSRVTSRRVRCSKYEAFVVTVVTSMFSHCTESTRREGAESWDRRGESSNDAAIILYNLQIKRRHCPGSKDSSVEGSKA